jgi:hypothetical protein
MLAIPEINRLWYVHRPRKLLISFLFFGVGNFRMAFSFSRSVVIPSGDTIFPSYLTSFWKVGTSPDWALGGHLGTVGILSAAWVGALGTCVQSWSRRPGTTSLERCRGQRAWLWTALFLDPSRTQSSHCMDADSPANNRSSGPERRTIWLLPACPECLQPGAVGRSLSLRLRSVSCSLRRSAGPRSSRRERWDKTRDWLTLR